MSIEMMPPLGEINNNGKDLIEDKNNTNILVAPVEDYFTYFQNKLGVKLGKETKGTIANNDSPDFRKKLIDKFTSMAAEQSADSDDLPL